MKKFLTTLCVIGVTMSFANEGACPKKEDHRNGCKPPKEAIEVCVGKTTDTACQVTSRHGDLLNGTCKNTPDEKYFACVPEKKRKHK